MDFFGKFGASLNKRKSLFLIVFLTRADLLFRFGRH
jgi:hypothetical protein